MTDQINGELAVANGGEHARGTKQPRAILDEDEYTSTLSHVVTRDYFPSLHSLRRDAAILEARSRGDVAGAVAVRRMARREEVEREREREEEAEAEREAATETALVPHRTVQVRRRPRPLKHESITGFHARVTSEDNAEFEMNQDREMKEREETLGVIYAARADKGGRLMIESHLNKHDEAEQPSTNKTSNNARALCDTPLGLSSDLYDAPPSAGLRITGGDANQIESDGPSGIGRNGLFFQPHHNPDKSQADEGARKLMLTSGSGQSGLAIENGGDSDGAENSADGGKDKLLMPPPPARLPGASGATDPPETELSTKVAISLDQRSQLVEYLPKPLPDINPPATRFSYQNESQLLGVPNYARSNLAANRSSARSTSSYAETSDTTDLDATPPPLDRERASHRRARLRENETFVAMTPLIEPGGGNASKRHKTQSDFESDEPIMTWGDVASTPLVLGNGAAVDGPASSTDWEPTRPSSLSEGVDVQGDSSAPAFDVVDMSGREALARRAERGLSERAKTYRSAGSRGSINHREKDKGDDESVRSSRSTSTASTPLDRTSSLTPAARALLEATKKAGKSKNTSAPKSRSSSSRIFQTPSFSSGSVHVGSRDSFGSALRMSYTPKVDPRGRDASRKRKGTSSMRRAVEGSTPRCHSLR
ncbi:hypothetical protein ACHAWF_012256 [Thalassiosira exigua]